ncbi:hypothetical protein H0H87_005675 [Tephrocybe sp. NHM501043]|nr:hypothetical protein H0H87_005675 [Tephrocybe sp. NHM501043]
MSFWNQPTASPQQRVRKLWDDFEKWAAGQRKKLHSQLAEVHRTQDAKWKATPVKNRNQAQHEETTKKQLQDAGGRHSAMLLEEWRERMQKSGLSDEDWGEMSEAENVRIARVFDEENDRIVSAPVARNVYAQPFTAPAYNPAPPMTSTARTVNLSASTSSSYQVIDPSSFSADDDDGYDAEESYVASTDESGDEYFSLPTKVSSHGSQKTSPDHLSSSSSTAYEVVQPLSSSSKLETSLEPQKRPPDTDRKGKSRAPGPAYVGPYLSNPEDSSDEDDFTMFKMQTRIDKIWEFHYAAALADVRLVMAIANDRMSKTPFDEKARVSEHESQMRQLQKDKEEERQATVDAERKKRREEIRKRPVGGEHTWAADTYSLNSRSDWESKFTNDHPVHLNVENMAFALGPASPSDEEQAWGVSTSDAWPETRGSVPSENFGTVRARRKSQTGAAPSGWKAKNTPSPPTTSSAQVHAASSTTESTSWYDHPVTSVHNTSFERDAFSAQASTPVPPIPAGWGEKPSATTLLKKVLSDPTTTRKHSLLSLESQSNFDHHASAFTSTTTKMPAKTLKGQHFTHGPDHHTADSLTTPTVTSNARSFASNIPPKDIQHSRYAHLHPEDETSSTPRPQGFMKRNIPDYASDMGPSTPKMGMSHMGMGVNSWHANEQSAHARQMAPQFDDGDDEGWGQVNALAEKAMEAIAPQTDVPWNAMRRTQGMGASQSQQTTRDEDAWGRGMFTSRLPATKTSPPGPEPSLWEQRTKPIAQASGFSQRPQPSSASEIPGEDFWKAAHSQLKSTQPQPQPEETPWERMQRLRSQGSAPGSDATPTFDPPSHPTVEDEPDDEAPGGRYAQHEPLPNNSRHLLDIAEPKPSHPPTAFSDVIDFDDEIDGEYPDGLSSSVPTPSTAPTSPPMSDEEQWMMAVAENAKKGDFSAIPAETLSNTTKPASGWSSGPPAKKSAWGAQKLDPAKLQSALQSVPTTTTPPKAASATTPPATASVTVAPAPAPKAEAAAASVTPPKAAAAPEKPEPAAKTGNQNQKGKKGKGKGRR